LNLPIPFGTKSMVKRRDRWNYEGRLLALFALLLLGWFLVPLPWKRQGLRILEELQAPIYYAVDAWDTAASYGAIRALSKDELARRVVELNRTLASERLQRRLENGKLPPAHRMEGLGKPYSPLYGKILHREENSWWQEVGINRGQRDGVAENQALVASDYLVGRTLRMGSHHCVALLTTDSRFHIVAHLEGDDRPIVYEGVPQKGFGPPKGRALHIPLDVGTSPGKPLTLVTSSLSGTYPDGVLIGKIPSLKPGADGMFQEGTVLLPPGLSSVREVAILRPRGWEEGEP
jgi:rod shape-determining protein MreC